MNINEPKRKPIYAHLTLDAKVGLDQIAKYHRTTLTNLLEEGARLVIKNHLKEIHVRNVESQQMRSSPNHASGW
jgi:hypothetical protein